MCCTVLPSFLLSPFSFFPVSRPSPLPPLFQSLPHSSLFVSSTPFPSSFSFLSLSPLFPLSLFPSPPLLHSPLPLFFFVSPSLLPTSLLTLLPLSPLHCKRFRLLQPYFGHLSCIPFVCVTRKVKGMFTIWKSLVEKLPSFLLLSESLQSALLMRFVISFFDLTQLPLDSSLVVWLW